MKSYCETITHQRIDWNKFLEKPIKSAYEIKIAKIKSESWTTCAVGNQCDVIKRDSIGCPFDYELKRLGSAFHLLIENELYDNAKDVLQKIEKRSIELINEIQNKTT